MSLQLLVFKVNSYVIISQNRALAKRVASIDKKRCVACGVCENTCPLAAVKVHRGCYAVVEEAVCVGCGKCAQYCPAGCIEMRGRVAV